MKNPSRQTPSATVALLCWLAVAGFSIPDLATPASAATPGSIQFAEPNYTVGEAAGTVTLVATRTGGSDGAVSGYYKTADGTALATQDYRPTTNYVSWAAGDAAPKNIVITLVNNTVAEPTESFTVTFVAASGGATLGTPATATVTITDDDTAVVNHGTIQFAEPNYTVSEAAGTVTLVATRAGGSGGAISGYYKTVAGTALAGHDFVGATNYVNWADGETAAKNIVLTILNDTVAEPTKAFTVTFFGASTGVTLGTPATATVTITDDDTAVVNHGRIQFAEPNYTVSEAAGTVTLVTTRTGGSDGAVSAYYKTSNGTALAGQDFVGITNVVNWADGDAAPKNIVLTILNDTVPEPTESFTVALIVGSGDATLGTLATATVTITDDDTAVVNHGRIQFAEPNYTVSENAGTATLVATRTEGSDGAVSAYYKTADGTAVAGQDFVASTNAVSWADGDSAPKNIVVGVVNDTVAEPTENFTVTLFATSGFATLGTPATATVTITDDDTAVVNHGRIQFAEPNYTVGESAGTVTLVATRTDGTGGAVSAYFRTADGTARAGQDYVALANAVSWADGDAAPKSIVLTILDDTVAEPTETFTVTLFATAGDARLGTPATATVTILDDDPVVVSPGSIQFAADHFTVGEAAGSVALYATRTGGNHGEVNAYYKTTDGSALAGQDYVAKTNYVHWADGDTEAKRISITILNDTLAEPTETFTVTLFAASVGVTLGTPATATVTILDDDAAVVDHGTVQFAAENYAVSEADGSVTLVVTRAGGAGGNISAYYKTVNGTAVAEHDYVATRNVLTWTDGDTTPKNIVVTILNDDVPEPAETFTVTLIAAAGDARLGTPATATVTITDDDAVVVNHGTIQFAAENYTVGEADGTVTLVATRAGGSSGAVSGYYKTVNGTAHAEQDFVAVANAVTWADGDTAPKNIIVTILNDTAAEPTETFTVTFLATSGSATLGTPATATVTILDDDTGTPPPPPNRPPIAHAQSVVTTVNLPVPVTLAGSDDDGDPLTFTVFRGPFRGTLTGASPDFIYTPPTDLTGQDYLQFVANDGKTNSRTAIVHFFINSNAAVVPTIKLLAPLANAYFVGPTNLDLAAEAAAPDGIYAVEFLEGTNSLGIATTPPFVFTWTNAVPGVYTIVANVIDKLGKTGVSEPATIRILPAEPIVTVRPNPGGTTEVSWPRVLVEGDLEESTDLFRWNLSTNNVTTTTTDSTITAPTSTVRFYRFRLR